ncbi:MAG: GHMP kinase [Dehalococcoidia bacterium]|nr:GHMP kinase [Dehalococcoidia bacterium]MDW8119886.1 GHMP kinase [Chloroflexota bacterium]
MIIVQTPLRISLAGGGTDLPDYYQRREGFVVNAAIDKYVFVIVNERYDDKIYINYSRKEIVDRVEDIRHELVREAMLITGVKDGVEVTTLADVPSEGSGLGSSSSLTVGLLNAFHIYRGEQVGPHQLAEEACQVEIERCGKPIGKQDQYIAAFGGVCALRFRSDGQVEVERLPLTERDLRRLSAHLLLVYTGVTRQASNILSVQKARTEANLDYLDAIKALALEVRTALLEGNWDRIGWALDENWRLKKQLAPGISNSLIDDMYERARQAGALGGKITGAGGGGFLLLYCPPQHHQAVLRALDGYRPMPFMVERDGSKVIFNYRRYTWR